MCVSRASLRLEIYLIKVCCKARGLCEKRTSRRLFKSPIVKRGAALAAETHDEYGAREARKRGACMCLEARGSGGEYGACMCMYLWRKPVKMDMCRHVPFAMHVWPFYVHLPGSVLHGGAWRCLLDEYAVAWCLPLGSVCV